MLRARDLRVDSFRALLPPAILLEELPATETGSATVAHGREGIGRALRDEDDRLVVVVGPTSLHDPVAGLEYGGHLRDLAVELARDLLLVMRVSLGKPPGSAGWQGPVTDPHLDGSLAINEGLRRARRLLLDLGELGVPAGCEFSDPIAPQFTADLVSWGAIGAHATESQVHRELASGLSMPVGFSSGAGGVQIAIDAVRAAAHRHTFLGVTVQGLTAIVATRGNPDCHVVIRGGQTGPDPGAPALPAVTRALAGANLPPRVMIDASQGGERDWRQHPLAARAVGEQLTRGEVGIFAVLLASFLVDGRQERIPGAGLRHGQSVAGACMGWETTEQVLRELAGAVRARRRTGGGEGPRPDRPDDRRPPGVPEERRRSPVR